MRYIYGAGKRGLLIYFILKDYGVKIDGFIDRDKTKKGVLIDEIGCVDVFDRKIQTNKNIEIIVSNKDSFEIMANLRSLLPNASLTCWNEVKEKYPIKATRVEDEKEMKSIFNEVLNW